ncbi:Glucose-1-phosphate adenylyltransferase [Olavius algarvensis spirochete endosymbiont]|uniref:glucose-1-phosphate adenylyltransferase n=1 Tax=Olavius algarvensis spirochete endosymbiont TaxID=260710 RepID=UPI00052BE45B|nr:glucose-1-phosphate adenylyltransferase [Olavius algarvensis spirochete endosymbiont]KGM43041.1 glucose-1-phosphate adenylyltransferase [Alkalispirochaeta odontotermitis]VDB01259.1 Glucose-1-phosphate adenylyltransferase [Olavius algarvensis spirochete endosymbiont]
MNKTLTIILGGGKGTRLYPLTKDRAKPSCPFGGKYRLVDIPISNSINSGFRKIYVLTQFNSASLHLHIGRTYNFDPFSRDFCEILAAEQTFHHESWYGGTADAVRKNLDHFRIQKPSHYIVLSGDQLYRMNLHEYMSQHIESGAQVTIAATPVSQSAAKELGILQIDAGNHINAFLEKPNPEQDISAYKIPEKSITDGDRKERREYLASMGIYIFDAEVMEKALDCVSTDFGREIIPDSIENFNVMAYIYRGYWEDIGSIRSFYEANINLGSPFPHFNLYDQESPLYTHRRDLPPTKINSSTLRNSIASEGSIITDAHIDRSLIGIRTIIDSKATLEEVYAMGADFYETEEEKISNVRNKIPHIGIGADSMIRGAIIDKNARIGRGCRIGIDTLMREDGDFNGYAIRDGIIIILKGAVIADGTTI